MNIDIDFHPKKVLALAILMSFGSAAYAVQVPQNKKNDVLDGLYVVMDNGTQNNIDNCSVLFSNGEFTSSQMSVEANKISIPFDLSSQKYRMEDLRGQSLTLTCDIAEDKLNYQVSISENPKTPGKINLSNDSRYDVFATTKTKAYNNKESKYGIFISIKEHGSAMRVVKSKSGSRTAAITGSESPIEGMTSLLAYEESMSPLDIFKVLKGVEEISKMMLGNQDKARFTQLESDLEEYIANMAQEQELKDASEDARRATLRISEVMNRFFTYGDLYPGMSDQEIYEYLTKELVPAIDDLLNGQIANADIDNSVLRLSQLWSDTSYDYYDRVVRIQNNYQAALEQLMYLHKVDMLIKGWLVYYHTEVGDDAQAIADAKFEYKMAAVNADSQILQATDLPTSSLYLQSLYSEATAHRTALGTCANNGYHPGEFSARIYGYLGCDANMSNHWGGWYFTLTLSDNMRRDMNGKRHTISAQDFSDLGETKRRISDTWNGYYNGWVLPNQVNPAEANKGELIKTTEEFNKLVQFVLQDTSQVALLPQSASKS